MIGSQTSPSRVRSLDEAVNIARFANAVVWAIVVEESPSFHTGIRNSLVYKVFPDGSIEENGLRPAA